MVMRTVYNATLTPAVAGAQATMLPASIISRIVQGDPLGFGIAVAQGTTDKSIVKYSESPNRFVGITLLDRSAAGEGDTFLMGDMARVMVEGDVWVEASMVVAAGDRVYVDEDGAFTNVDTDTPVPGVRWPAAYWETSTTAPGQLAVVRIA